MTRAPDRTPQPVDVIATRIFELEVDGSHIPIACNVYRPETSKDAGAYYCWVEVEWPSGPERKWAAGEDAIQAMELALVALGILINTSSPARENRLTLQGSTKGFGLPLPVHLWSQYREHDRQCYLNEYRVPRPPRYHRLNLRSTAPKHLRMHKRPTNRCWCGGIVGNSKRPKRIIKRPD